MFRKVIKAVDKAARDVDKATKGMGKVVHEQLKEQGVYVSGHPRVEKAWDEACEVVKALGGEVWSSARR